MLTINIHKNQVTISDGPKTLLHGEKPMINLDNIIPTYNSHLKILPNLVGDYFTSDGEVVITYNPLLPESNVTSIGPTQRTATEGSALTRTKEELHSLYIQLAIAYTTTPTIVTVEEPT